MNTWEFASRTFQFANARPVINLFAGCGMIYFRNTWIDIDRGYEFVSIEIEKKLKKRNNNVEILDNFLTFKIYNFCSNLFSTCFSWHLLFVVVINSGTIGSCRKIKKIFYDLILFVDKRMNLEKLNVFL